MARRLRVRSAAIGAVLALGALAWAGVPAAAQTAPVPLEDLSVTTTQLASGLARPTALFAPDDGSGRLLITEKAGTVRAWDAEGGLAAEPLLDITDRVDVSGNERGLLGIVTPPDVADDPALYVAYTSLPDGALTLSRFALDAPDQAAIPAEREEVLLTQAHAEYSNHNGGQLAFGPDGHLYWSMGDGGGADDVLDNGQDPGTLLGSILRIDVSAACGDTAYCVPEDNPFVGQDGARPEIWVYGLRNPWRFSFDTATDDLWIADVGQGTWEEVDHLAAGVSGVNFGWSCREGAHAFDPDRCTDGADYVEPVFEYQTSVDGCAIIGGFVYHGEQTPAADGTYLATDYCSATAFALRPADGGGYERARIGELPIQPTSLGVGPDGELYMVNDLPGQLHRITLAASEPEPTATCTVGYSVDSQWGTAFVATVTVTNTGDAPLDGWQLGWEFAAGQRIQHGWSADVSQDGTRVTAGNRDWNAAVPAGDTVSFGFMASHGGSNPAPDAFTLDGAPCG